MLGYDIWLHVVSYLGYETSINLIEALKLRDIDILKKIVKYESKSYRMYVSYKILNKKGTFDEPLNQAILLCRNPLKLARVFIPNEPVIFSKSRGGIYSEKTFQYMLQMDDYIYADFSIPKYLLHKYESRIKPILWNKICENSALMNDYYIYNNFKHRLTDESINILFGERAIPPESVQNLLPIITKKSWTNFSHSSGFCTNNDFKYILQHFKEYIDYSHVIFCYNILDDFDEYKEYILADKTNNVWASMVGCDIDKRMANYLITFKEYLDYTPLSDDQYEDVRSCGYVPDYCMSKLISINLDIMFQCICFNPAGHYKSCLNNMMHKHFHRIVY